MKKTRILSLLLCLSIFCTLIVPGTRAYAESDPDNGMKISKTATANGDGSYTITLEAFATGSKVITEQKTDIPTDIVLVLDQSGSMANDIGQVQYTAYTGNNTQNKSNYEKRHNGGSANLWHKLPDGSYVSVSVTKTTIYKDLNIELPNYSRRDECYWDYANNLYEKVGEEYKKVTVNYDRDNFSYTYTYTFADGTTVTSVGNGSTPDFGSHAPLYTPVADGNNTVYTYTYTDSAGVVQTIGTSTGANTEFNPAFYQRSTTTSGGGTRLDALKNAVNNFASAVRTKSLGKDGQVGGGDDIDHRIALVGFSSSDYRNTELLTGSSIEQGEWQGEDISTGGYYGYYYFPTGYEMNGPQYGSISDAQYKAALLAMNTDAGWSGVTSGVNALTAWGGTRTDNGLEMANKIFEQNPIPNGEKRNRVVIVFTDGIPGLTGYDSEVASSAITQASTAKSTYGATVYAIGVFPGADATSAGSTGDSSSDADKGNYFLQRVSSNTQYPQSPSYYLSAGDSASLNNIFQQISNQIETGGAETTLGSETVVKDVISPYFTLPAGTTASDIRIDTYACTGKDGNTYTWSSTSGGSGGASATVSDDQVSVTGFDFSENWCGTETDAQGHSTVRGKKLVISFTVDPKSAFLGGNDVITNTSAGIYENGFAQTPVMTFEQPTVNVPIKDVTVTATDKNVYLKGEVTADQLRDGATVKVGEDTKAVSLDLSKANENYDLEAWQTEYVDITVTVKDKDGNPISDKLENLTEDTTYTVEVTVAPKTNGSSASGTPATEKDGKGEGKINVFKPELTYKDSEVYYGDTAPTDFSANLVKTEWKHNDTLDTTVTTMIGTAPELQFEYKPESGVDASNNKISTKKDIPVNVDVRVDGMATNESLNDFITFQHQDCNPACGWTTPNPNNGNPAFLLHVKTCTLTITKQGGAGDESYVFDVLKDGEKYSEVTVWGNGTETLVELPVGTYTIRENAGWSWRYSPNNGGSAALTAQNPTGSITCVNTKNNNQWLNGFSEVVHNIFGTNH